MDPYIGPGSQDTDYPIGSNFWKFYLIKTSFTLGERVSLVKVFRLFRLEQNFFGVETVDAVSRCTTSYLLTRPACLWCLVNFHAHPILVLGPKLIHYTYDTGTSREFLKLIYQSGINNSRNPISWCNGININMTNMIPAGINFQLWYKSSVSLRWFLRALSMEIHSMLCITKAIRVDIQKPDCSHWKTERNKRDMLESSAREQPTSLMKRLSANSK